MCLAKVCFTFDFIPCGEVSLDAQAALENYRAQQLSYAAERQDIAMDDVEYPDVSNAISTGAAETFTKLLYQFDIASNVYAVYSCLALLFPVPLDVFRFPHSGTTLTINLYFLSPSLILTLCLFPCSRFSRCSKFHIRCSKGLLYPWSSRNLVGLLVHSDCSVLVRGAALFRKSPSWRSMLSRRKLHRCKTRYPARPLPTAASDGT